MRTSLVNSAAGVIQRAMQRCETAAGVAIALDSAQMLQDPQTAAEREQLRARVAELEAAPDLGWVPKLGTSEQAAFLDELAAMAITHADLTTSVKEVLKTVADWRATAKAAGVFGPVDEAGKDTADGGESTRADAPELTVYRAQHDSIPMGLYTTRQAAYEHCEAHELRDDPASPMCWKVDEDGVAELHRTFSTRSPGADAPTGFVVTPLTVASYYDEEADE